LAEVNIIQQVTDTLPEVESKLLLSPQENSIAANLHLLMLDKLQKDQAAFAAS